MCDNLALAGATPAESHLDLLRFFFKDCVIDKYGDGKDACCKHQEGQRSPNIREEQTYQ